MKPIHDAAVGLTVGICSSIGRRVRRIALPGGALTGCVAAVALVLVCGYPMPAQPKDIHAESWATVLAQAAVQDGVQVVAVGPELAMRARASEGGSFEKAVAAFQATTGWEVQRHAQAVALRPPVTQRQSRLYESSARQFSARIRHLQAFAQLRAALGDQLSLLIGPRMIPVERLTPEARQALRQYLGEYVALTLQVPAPAGAEGKAEVFGNDAFVQFQILPVLSLEWKEPPRERLAVLSRPPAAGRSAAPATVTGNPGAIADPAQAPVPARSAPLGEQITKREWVEVVPPGSCTLQDLCARIGDLLGSRLYCDARIKEWPLVSTVTSGAFADVWRVVENCGWIRVDAVSKDTLFLRPGVPASDEPYAEVDRAALQLFGRALRDATVAEAFWDLLFLPWTVDEYLAGGVTDYEQLSHDAKRLISEMAGSRIRERGAPVRVHRLAGLFIRYRASPHQTVVTTTDHMMGKTEKFPVVEVFRGGVRVY